MPKIFWLIPALLILFLVPATAAQSHSAERDDRCPVLLTVPGLNCGAGILRRLALHLDLGRKAVQSLSLPDLSTLGAGQQNGSHWISLYNEELSTLQRNHPDEQVCVLAYSLGGLIAVHGAAQGFVPDRLLLLAPALSLRPIAYLPRLLTPLSRLGLALPSFTPKQYRKSDWTSLADYNGLYSLLSEIDRDGNELREHAPATLVIIRDSDELVSPSGLRSFLTEHSLPWELTVLRTDDRKHRNDHLAIAAGDSSDPDFPKVQETITGFLNPQHKN